MAKKLSKWCSGCRCSTCRWRGTDNCLHDRNKLCNMCHGNKKIVAVFMREAQMCKGYEMDWEHAQRAEQRKAEIRAMLEKVKHDT